jgi:hypothetical protein
LAQDIEEWRAVLKFGIPMETVKFLARWVSGSFSKIGQIHLWGCGYTIYTSVHTATRNSLPSVIKQYGSVKNLYADRSRKDWWKVNLVVSNRHWQVQRISTAQTETASGELLFKY